MAQYDSGRTLELDKSGLGRRQTTIINLYGQILEIEESGETVFIPVKQIRYIEAQDKYTLAVMGTGEHLMRKTMKFWKNILPGEE